jgi:tetratricopeptide (TPR) repeat protein
VLSFAPAEPDRATRAMYLALVTGVVAFAEQGDDTQIHATAMAEPEEEFLFEDDFGDEPDLPDIPEDGPPPEALGDEPTAATFDPSVARLRAEIERVQGCEDFFAVLGVHWDASEADYRKAWFSMARQWHPDRWQSESDVARELVDELFASLNEAWATLGDADAREVYINSVIHGIQSEEELAMEKVRAILAAEDQFKAGLQRYHRGDLMGAHEFFKTAHEMVPEESEFQAYLGYTVFKIHWGKQPERAQEGVKMIKEAIDNHVKLDAGWVLLGKVFREVGKQKASVNAFKRALEMNAGNAEAERELKRTVATLKKDVEKKKQEDKKGGFFGRFFGKK